MPIIFTIGHLTELQGRDSANLVASLRQHQSVSVQTPLRSHADEEGNYYGPITYSVAVS